MAHLLQKARQIINRHKACKTRTKLVVLCMVSSFLLTIGPGSIYAEEKLVDKDFQEILRTYTIIGDFIVKDEIRPISSEIFWRYPLTISPPNFQSGFTLDKVKDDFVATQGGGREFEHINSARALFLQGEFEKARATLLTARAKYGNEHAYNRRVDFYLGITILAAGEKYKKEVKNPHPIIARTFDENATTFLSWALISKKNQQDEVVEKHAPFYYYELASLYFKYKRYSAAYGAATAGLEFLQHTGRKDFRSQFNSMVAEILLQNREYLKSVQYLDKAIRHDPDEELAPENFARIADIYYNLNNFELAEEFYDLAFRIAKDVKKIRREHLILRAECLFWLSRFEEAEKVLSYALSDYSSLIEISPPSQKHLGYARLRFADLALAQGRYEQATLRYFQARHYSSDQEVKDIAHIRMACLDLPAYKGKNLGHARTLFDSLKQPGTKLSLEAIEVGETCNVASYAQYERDESMVKQVREFYAKYPNSAFLKKLIPPLQEFRAKAFEDYYKKRDFYAAVSYFEENSTTVFPKIDTDLGAKLFYSFFYVDKIKEAEKYYPDFLTVSKKNPRADIRIIQAIFITELMQLKPKDKQLRKQSESLATNLKANPPQIDYSDGYLKYLTRSTDFKETIPHFSWRYELVKSWWPKKPELLCSMSFPLLMRMEEHHIDEAQKHGRLVDLIDYHYEAKLEGKNACLSSLLDLEYRLLSDQSELLGRRWETRMTWPLTPEITAFYWRVGEKMLRDNQKELGEKFLHHIIEKAPADAPERGFAKLRLDKSRTHLEKLWR